MFWWWFIGTILAIGLVLAIFAHISTRFELEMGWLTGEFLPAMCPGWSYAHDGYSDSWRHLILSYLSVIFFWPFVSIFYLALIAAFLGLSITVVILVLLINIFNLEPQQPIH